MRDLIPENMRGTFFSKRMRLSTSVGIVLNLLAATYLDAWKKYVPEQELAGYSILFVVGVIAGIIGIYFLSRTPEIRMSPSPDNNSIFRVLAQPFRDENFRKLMAFMCSWNFAVNLAAPFFTVFMLRRMELPMSLIIGLGIISQVFNVMFLKIWGRFTDRFSNKSVLAVCGPLFMFAILAWAFVLMPDKYALTYPLLILIHVTIGLAGAGVTLATTNIGLKLAPKGQATAYLATNTITNSLAAGIAPILGGTLAHFFSKRSLCWTLRYTGPEGEFLLPTLNLTHWDFFFAIAFLIGLYALHRLSMIKETGEVEDKVVRDALFFEVRTQVRSLSSVESVKQMLAFPVSSIRNLTTKKNDSKLP